MLLVTGMWIKIKPLLVRIQWLLSLALIPLPAQLSTVTCCSVFLIRLCNSYPKLLGVLSSKENYLNDNGAWPICPINGPSGTKSIQSMDGYFSKGLRVSAYFSY